MGVTSIISHHLLDVRLTQLFLATLLSCCEFLFTDGE